MADCRRNPDSGREDKVPVKKGEILETRWSLKWGVGWDLEILWHSAVSISVSQLAGRRGKVSHRTPISQRLHLSLSKSHWLLNPANTAYYSLWPLNSSDTPSICADYRFNKHLQFCVAITFGLIHIMSYLTYFEHCYIGRFLGLSLMWLQICTPITNLLFWETCLFSSSRVLHVLRLRKRGIPLI